MTDEKKCALRTYLNDEGYSIAYSNIDTEQYLDNGYEADGAEYLVMDDEEANDCAYEHIMDLLYAFNAEFIIDHSGLPYDAIEMIRSYQEDKCEDANNTIYALIDDPQEFVDDAIAADGRGHFINPYDGEEIESGEYFIYRMN